MEHNQKKIWPYFLCAGITAVAVFFATIFGVAIALRFRQRSSVFTPAENGETPAYLTKVEELVSLLDEKYVDGLDMQRLDDYLSEAAVAATGAIISAQRILTPIWNPMQTPMSESV